MIKSKFKIISPIYLCHPDGRFATSGEVASPNYNPCVRFTITKRHKLRRSGRNKYWGNNILRGGPALSKGYVYSPYIPVLTSPPPFQISSRLIKTKSRKLKTKWSLYRDPTDLAARGFGKRKSWTIVYNHDTKRLYDLRRDGQLIRIKVKKRCLKRIVALIDSRKFEIFKSQNNFFFPKQKITPKIKKLNSNFYSVVTIKNL